MAIQQQQQHGGQEVGVVNEGSLSPPTSPKFSAPPIRSAALKSMFPQVCTPSHHHTLTPSHLHTVTPSLPHQVSSKPGSSTALQAPPHSSTSSPFTEDHAPPPPPAPGGGQVVTKTMFSGTLASSRRCQECGQLNSRMAKKCMQCRSPLQGKGCHRCVQCRLDMYMHVHTMYVMYMHVVVVTHTVEPL